MKYVYLLITLFLIFSCKKEVVKNELEVKKDSIRTKQKNYDSTDTIKESNFEDELEANEEVVSVDNFKVWEGKYNTNYEYSDMEYNEFIVFTKLNLIKQDSCIFENWFENKEDKKQKKNNYVKIIGKLYFASDNNSKIEFMENKIFKGESPNLSPVFSLKKNNNQFLINSILSSPPNNGVIDMPISKE